jgi:hypothetical protein
MAKGSGKWFAILVIIIFLASTFSVLLYANNGDDSSDTTTKTIDDPTTNLPIVYTANVNGKVLEVPTSGAFRFMAYTNEVQVNLIDSSIKDLNNIYNVVSTIQINSDTNTVNATYVYLADIVGSNVDYNYLFTSLKANTYFVNDIALYPYAKIDYNSFVTFENKDLNNVKIYDIGGNQIMVLVDSSTLVNDEISFVIQAQFIGDVLGGYQAYQLQNLSASPKTINSIYKGKFVKEIYDLSIDANILESKFAFLKDNGLDFNYNQYDGKVDLTVDKENDLGKYLLAMNSFEKDNNAKLTANVYGSIFVDTITYIDKNYDVNRDVSVLMDYNSYINMTDDLEYNVMAYIIRDEVVGATATPIIGIGN